jgi:hypothetical protein
MAVGLILVVIGAYFIDSYLFRPVSEIEEGLLAIMNGRTDLRFDIEHAELGGLVFRLNSLLNHLLNVGEDNTEDHSQLSRPVVVARHLEDAFAVDERMAVGARDETPDSRILRQEAASRYYARIFEEYIAAKKSVGDPTDHITRDAFIDRIKTSESEMAHKHGKPVRYRVEVRNKEVVLLAVPLE